LKLPGCVVGVAEQKKEVRNGIIRLWFLE